MWEMGCRGACGYCPPPDAEKVCLLGQGGVAFGMFRLNVEVCDGAMHVLVEWLPKELPKEWLKQNSSTPALRREYISCRLKIGVEEFWFLCMKRCVVYGGGGGAYLALIRGGRGDSLS